MIYVLAQRMTLLVPCDSQIIAYYYFIYKLHAWTRYTAYHRLVWYRMIFTLTLVQYLWKVTQLISTEEISMTTGQITHKYI